MSPWIHNRFKSYDTHRGKDDKETGKRGTTLRISSCYARERFSLVSNPSLSTDDTWRYTLSQFKPIYILVIHLYIIYPRHRSSKRPCTCVRPSGGSAILKGPWAVLCSKHSFRNVETVNVPHYFMWVRMICPHTEQIGWLRDNCYCSLRFVAWTPKSRLTFFLRLLSLSR
jgi:hypothetical protein